LEVACGPCHRGGMSREVSSATDQPELADTLSRHESAVRTALAEHWGLGDALVQMPPNLASVTWYAGGYVVKLANDEPAHITAGLHASELVEEAGIATGAPVRTRSGRLCVALPDAPSLVLCVLRRVEGSPLSMHAVAPEVLGEMLGRLHRVVRGCPATGAWTPTDVVGHMMSGLMATHSAEIQTMITQAVDDVSAYYANGPRTQLLYGDGPGILTVNGTDISAIVDWGGVRDGSVADDIGCWTAHGATDRIPLPAYTAALLDGYRRTNEISPDEIAAVVLFQRLRIASRACYVSDPESLAATLAWMQDAVKGLDR
jgi:Ser/Thr protein kinase RdoA (MazF antagonist)